MDSHGRILSQQPASLSAVKASSHELVVEIGVSRNAHLDLTLWRLPPEASDIEESLIRPLVLEKQPIFLGGSHSVYRSPSDVYLCLVHGHVYDNRFVWRPRWPDLKWRICSENEAYSLYVALHGLELATNKRLYSLLKRQILFSVIARQAPDGGWYHGEWTDLMESHFRLHNAAVRMLEVAVENSRDPVVQFALEKAVSFTSRQTDKIEYGLWFLHDSLEESEEMATVRGAPRWVPSHALGKSTTNKLILNTHLDAIVVLDRYREITGDNQYAEHVASARIAARALLNLHPAERLYRVLFWAIGLTLVPTSEVNRMPLALRATRRLTLKYIAPHLHNVKRIFPRFVMPGGLIDRHLSPPYFTVGYHPVNVMDLARLWRRFPDEELGELLDQATKALTDSRLLPYWVEAKQRQPIGYWVEALYHLCTILPTRVYRHHLAEAILAAADAELGLPPSLLGANSEAVSPDQQVPCPSPTDERLRIANLSYGAKREFLVVNPSRAELDLNWEGSPSLPPCWLGSNGQVMPAAGWPLRVPSRGWVLGRD